MSGTLVKTIGFEWMLFGIAILNFLYAPLLYCLKSPPTKEEKKVIMVLPKRIIEIRSNRVHYFDRNIWKFQLLSVIQIQIPILGIFPIVLFLFVTRKEICIGNIRKMSNFVWLSKKIKFSNKLLFILMYRIVKNTLIAGNIYMQNRG